MADLEYRDTPDQIDRETLLLLGADLAARGFRVPRVTVAGVALLDLIDSPFLTGDREPKLMDVLKAMYVLERQTEAASDIMAASRARTEIIAAHVRQTRTSDGDAQMYAALAQVALMWQAFDEKVVVFSEGCGQFELADVTLGLRDAISRSCGGFAMIQREGDSAEKKTAQAGSSTGNGLRKLWRLFLRYLTLRRMKSCS